MEFLPLRLAARRLGVHPGTLRRWENEGRIACIRSGSGQRKFFIKDLDALLGVAPISSPNAGRHYIAVSLNVATR